MATSESDVVELDYALLTKQVVSLCAGEPDVIANMANVSALLAHAMNQHWNGCINWLGFYRVAEPSRKSLVLGPFQGKVACIRIPFGKGVCGTCAATDTTQVIADVHAFPGHIACDSDSASEIVVPVHNDTGTLIAVLDIDSRRKGTFGPQDARALEAMMEAAFAQPPPAAAPSDGHIRHAHTGAPDQHE